MESIRVAYDRTMTSGRARPAASVVDARLTVERVVAGGDGLARQGDGRVVFVPGALPGEQVDVRIVGAKKDFARAALAHVVTPHADRVEPPCPAWHRGCGGCDWQHADASLQLAMKVDIVRESLHRTGRIAEPQVVAGGAVPSWAYRTTMRFALDGRGRPSLHRSRSNDVVALDGCMVAHPGISELLPALRLPGADEVTLRVSAATGERTAWWTPASAPVAGLPDDVRTGADATLVEHVGGVALRVRAASFFQSGPHAAELLVATVRDVCGDALHAARRVVDAYGGIGLFSATIVPAAAEVALVEASPSACDDAVHNLSARGPGVTVSNCLLEDWTPSAADLVIADPTRQGLGAVAVDRLVATGADTIVLVSCDPVALARDVTLLRAHGYEPGATVVVDLFPQTHHVESVTRFDRVGSIGS